MSAEGRVFAALEAGGTKFRGAVFGDDETVLDEVWVPTTDPEPTLAAVIEWFGTFQGRIEGLGISCFGPLDLRPGRATYGALMATPKPGWSGVPVLTPLREALGVPAMIDTDVGGAALAEAAVGAGVGCDVIVYVTVGTGIGAATSIRGDVHHGHGHSEFGHITVTRLPGDTFPGVCPFHGDCLEGVASGAALDRRREVSEPESAERFEAGYLAQLARTLTYTVAPDRIIFGGGFFRDPELIHAVRDATARELAGYSTNPEVTGDVETYIATAALGQDAGLVGAGLMARRAWQSMSGEGSPVGAGFGQ